MEEWVQIKQIIGRIHHATMMWKLSKMKKREKLMKTIRASFPLKLIRFKLQGFSFEQEPSRT